MPSVFSVLNLQQKQAKECYYVKRSKTIFAGFRNLFFFMLHFCMFFFFKFKSNKTKKARKKTIKNPRVWIFSHFDLIA